MHQQFKFNVAHSYTEFHRRLSNGTSEAHNYNESV